MIGEVVVKTAYITFAVLSPIVDKNATHKCTPLNERPIRLLLYGIRFTGAWSTMASGW